MLGNTLLCNLLQHVYFWLNAKHLYATCIKVPNKNRIFQLSWSKQTKLYVTFPIASCHETLLQLLLRKRVTSRNEIVVAATLKETSWRCFVFLLFLSCSVRVTNGFLTPDTRSYCPFCYVIYNPAYFKQVILIQFLMWAVIINFTCLLSLEIVYLFSTSPNGDCWIVIGKGSY